MKGLLLKDFYVAKKNLRTFLIMILAFSLGSLAVRDSGNFFLCYGIVMMPGITMSLISYDERYHWDTYAGAMPLNREQMVTEKYLLHLVMVLVWLPVLLVLQHFQQVPAFGGAPLTLLVAGLNLGLLLPAAVYGLSWRVAIRLYEKRSL